MSTGKVVLGTLAGIAIGAIAGILFAPDKGSKTRRKIMDKGNDYADDIKSKFEEFFESMETKIENVKKDAETMVDKGKDKYSEAKNEVKNIVTER